MTEQRFRVPEQIKVNEVIRKNLYELAIQELDSGAQAFGVFGRSTYAPSTKDVDVIVVRPGIQRGGITLRNGIFHLNYFPLDIMSDPLATFGHQAYTSAVFIYNFL